MRGERDSMAAQWLRLARGDLAAAERLATGEPLPEQALFHCQQAGENALKSMVALRGSEPPRTHDLVQLLMLAGAEPSPELDTDAALLTQYAVAPRYPLQPREYAPEEIARALAAARRLVEHAAAAEAGQ